MDNAVILDNVIIRQSIVSPNVKIGAGATIEKGCIIGPRVVIGAQAKVPAFSRWLATDGKADVILGENAKGKLYLADSDDEDEDDHHQHRGHMGGSLERHMSIDEESMDGDLTGVTESDDEDEWIREVNQTLERAWKDNHTADIAALELNTLKMAFNITFHDLRALSIPFFVQHLEMDKLQASIKDVSRF
jgi:translation initiation factor eIF-2B subunit epsilon